MLLAVFVATPALADWKFVTRGGEFGPAKVAVTVQTADGYGLGFACEGDRVKMAYVTPEIFFDPKAIPQQLPKQIRYRVDGGTVRAIPAEVLSEGSNFGLTASISGEPLASFRDAKMKIAIVVSIGDKLFHEKVFDTSGSTAAFDAFRAACPYQKP